MDNSNLFINENKRESLKYYLGKLKSNNLTFFESNELLDLYTKEIAGDFGESKAFNDIVSNQDMFFGESSILLFPKIVLNLFQSENQTKSKLTDIWELLEKGEIENVLSYFLTIQNPDLLFYYYILNIYNLLYYSSTENKINNIKLVIEEIETRVPLNQRKIYLLKYFNSKFISKILYNLMQKDISVNEIFKREQVKNQYILIEELLLINDNSQEDKLKFIYKVLPLTSLVMEGKYVSKSLSLIARTAYTYEDFELANSLFLNAESKAVFDFSPSYVSILKDLKNIEDRELLFDILSKMINNMNKINNYHVRSDTFNELIDFIYEKINSKEDKIKLLVLAAPKVNLLQGSTSKFLHLIHIGKLYARMNEKEKAIEFLEKATLEVRGTSRVFYRVGMYSTISYFYMELVEIQNVKEIEKLILIELKKFSLPYDKMFSYCKLAELYLSIEETKKAKFYLFKIKFYLNKEKNYENIESILRSITPLVLNLQEMKYLDILFTIWIKKIEELESNDKIQLEIISLLEFLKEKFTLSQFEEYLLRLNSILTRSKIDSKSVLSSISKIKDANLKSTIWINISKDINLSDYQDSDLDLLSQLFYLFLDFKDDYNAGEVINILCKKIEVSENPIDVLKIVECIAKLSLNFPPNEKWISTILNETKKFDSIITLEDKINSLKIYLSIAESLELMGKKEESKLLFQKEIIEQRISPDTLDTILTLKSLSDNCIAFGKKEEAIFLLQKATSIINKDKSDLLLLLFSNSLELYHSKDHLESVFNQIFNNSGDYLNEISYNIFDKIISSLCLLENKKMTLTLLEKIYNIINSHNNIQKNYRVLFGFAKIEEYNIFRTKFELEVRSLFKRHGVAKSTLPLLNILDNNNEIITITEKLIVLQTVLDKVLEVKNIDNKNDEEVLEFMNEVCDSIIGTKNIEFAKLLYGYFYNISASFESENRILTQIYLSIAMEDIDPDLSTRDFKNICFLLKTIKDKKRLFPKIFSLIKKIRNPDNFKIIFRKLKKYNNKLLEKENNPDLQYNLDMANCYYRQFNFSSADFYFNRAKGIARSSKDSNSIALELSKILISNREIQKEEFFKDLFLEYLEELQNSTYSGLKIDSFTGVVTELLATENYKYLYYIEKFLYDHQEEIELTKHYKYILASYISEKKANLKLFSLFLRSFLLGSFDKALVTTQLRALIKILGNLGFISEALEIDSLSYTYLS